MQARIVAVDFDGTCVTHAYPEVGQEIGAAPVLRELADNGHRLILFTMRSGETLLDAINWFASHNIPLFGVNHNPEQASWTSSPKPYAHIYIDDAALGCPLTSNLHRPQARKYCDWASIRNLLAREGYFDATRLK